MERSGRGVADAPTLYQRVLGDRFAARVLSAMGIGVALSGWRDLAASFALSVADRRARE